MRPRRARREPVESGAGGDRVRMWRTRAASMMEKWAERLGGSGGWKA